MRLIAFIEYAAVVAGIIAMAAGEFFALPKGFQLGVFLVGAGIGIGGIEAIATQRMPFRAADDSWEAYAGVPALIVGVMALLVGAAIVGAAYLIADGKWHSTLRYLTLRPAPVLAAAGVLLACLGVLMTLNPRGRRGWAWMLFVYGPRALLGVLLVLAGIAAIGLGAWEWQDPRGFDELERKVRAYRLP